MRSTSKLATPGQEITGQEQVEPTREEKPSQPTSPASSPLAEPTNDRQATSSLDPLSASVTGEGARAASQAKAPISQGELPLLDKNGHNSTSGCWSRQQRRAYHRLMSCLAYWCEHGYQVRKVELTTAVGGRADLLSYHHQQLIQDVERKLGYGGLEFVKVITSEGNGVIHALWAWRGGRTFFVPHAWLANRWEQLHGARIVWIEAVKSGQGHRKGVSRYLAGQYLAGQECIERVDYSWRRTFNLPLVKVWRSWRGIFRDRGRRMATWGRLLAGEAIKLASGEVAQLEVRWGGGIDYGAAWRATYRVCAA